MYQAINDKVIIKKENETVTQSGIIIAEQDAAPVFEFIVVGTNEITKHLQDKKVYVERRHCIELPSIDGFKYASVKLENIVAWTN
jgi:co-chaperonin GroES (HSP10)